MALISGNKSSVGDCPGKNVLLPSTQVETAQKRDRQSGYPLKQQLLQVGATRATVEDDCLTVEIACTV